jgi:uncharacterized protein (DUF58 family)
MSDDNNYVPPVLYVYLVAVVLAGIAAAIAVAFVSLPQPSIDLLAVVFLLLLASIAERYQLHLTHKTRIHVASAVYIAMILALPAGLPGRAISVEGNARRQWLAKVRLTRRGSFRLGPLRVRTGDPFGLFTSEMQVGASTGVVVVTKVVALP